MLRLGPACGVVVALTLSLAPVARANAPAPYVRGPDRLGGAFVAAPTSLVVEREELSPVQLRSSAPALVGLRAQVTVSFSVVSLVVPFDWFPGGAGSEQGQIAMLAQASF